MYVLGIRKVNFEDMVNALISAGSLISASYLISAPLISPKGGAY